jgi:hypothetical protein
MGSTRRLSRALIVALSLGAAFGQRQTTDPDCHCPNQKAAAAHAEGVAAHRKRRLDEASDAYRRALTLAPSRDPRPAEHDLILRFAPRLFLNPREPFPLKDFAAVLHPDRPWITYHLFWDDDIDFPDDNDPCDHELVWVELDAARQRVTRVFTYFHGRILEAPPADVEDANRNGGRPAISVQWGKHGSMPRSWQKLWIESDRGDIEFRSNAARMTLAEYNRHTWQKLSTTGREAQDSPLARGWPQKFTGDLAQFTNFTRALDPRPMLRSKSYMQVSYFNNAVINRRFLVYNFSAKTEWPNAICETGRR